MFSNKTVDFLRRLACKKDGLATIVNSYAYSDRFIITMDLHALYKQLLEDANLSHRQRLWSKSKQIDAQSLSIEFFQKIIVGNPIEQVVMEYDYFARKQIAIIIDELQRKLLNNMDDFVDFVTLAKPNYFAKNVTRVHQGKIAKQKPSSMRLRKIAMSTKLPKLEVLYLAAKTSNFGIYLFN